MHKFKLFMKAIMVIVVWAATAGAVIMWSFILAQTMTSVWQSRPISLFMLLTSFCVGMAVRQWAVNIFLKKFVSQKDIEKMDAFSRGED